MRVKVCTHEFNRSTGAKMIEAAKAVTERSKQELEEEVRRSLDMQSHEEPALADEE